MISKTMVVNHYLCPRLYWLKYRSSSASNELASQKMYNALKVERTFIESFGGETVGVDSTLDLNQKIAKTKNLIDQGHHLITQATFAFNGLSCMVDLLEVHDNKVNLYEIKAVSTKENPEGKDVHLLDLAFQKYILEGLKYIVEEASLVYLKSGYVLDKELDYDELFDLIKLEDQEYEEYKDKIIEIIKDIKSLSIEPDPIKVDFCKNCSEFNKNCFVYDKKTILDISGIKIKRINSLMTKGKLFLDDSTFQISADELSSKQYEMVQDYLNQKDEFLPEAFQLLNKITYPLAFLDFETIQLAIPEFDGTKVYSQIPMQFALLTKEDIHSEGQYHEYLGSNKNNYLLDIADLLVKLIPEKAMVVAHNASFEQGVIKLLSTIYPKYEDHLMSFSWFDTRDLFERDVYRNGNLLGTTSMKKIVPVVLGEEMNDYSKYQFIKNGEDAMNELIKLHQTGYCDETIRKELLDYCKSDVTNMVRLLEYVSERSIRGY